MVPGLWIYQRGPSTHFDHSWDDTRVFRCALHRPRFPATRYAVGEDCRILRTDPGSKNVFIAGNSLSRSSMGWAYYASVDLFHTIHHVDTNPFSSIFHSAPSLATPNSHRLDLLENLFLRTFRSMAGIQLEFQPLRWIVLVPTWHRDGTVSQEDVVRVGSTVRGFVWSDTDVYRDGGVGHDAWWISVS